MQSIVSNDACIIDKNVNRSKSSLDDFDSSYAGVKIGDIPTIDVNSGRAERDANRSRPSLL